MHWIISGFLIGLGLFLAYVALHIILLIIAGIIEVIQKILGVF